MNALFKSIYVESVTKQDYYQEQIDKLMHQLFILFSRQLHSFPEGREFQADLFEEFRKARIEILTHIDRKWDADSMAALTNLGTSQFYSYYKLFFNRSPKSELLDARMERSKYLLRVEKLPVAQAAAQAGFVDETSILCEMAVSAYRAGTDIYISYFAEELAKCMEQGIIG